MIQLNLLPDVKVAYIKARGQKRLVILGSTIIASASLVIFILLFSYVHGVQSRSIDNLSTDIQSKSTELSSTKDLNKILTVQNQLQSLDALHNQKPALDRLPQYIATTTPSGVKLSAFNLDFATNGITLSGAAPGLDGINAYVDTLKAAKFTTKDDAKNLQSAFSDIVLTSFSRGDGEASFAITLIFDPVIFDSQKDVTLSINGVPAATENNDAFGIKQTKREDV